MPTLLQINNLDKSFGPHNIFSKAGFAVSKKERIGVIGRNGAGKTTLFKMILNQEKADSGEITIFPETRIGYLEQGGGFNPQEAVSGFLQRDSGREDWACAKMAARFQLKGRLLNTKIQELSGGYQMRVRLTAMLLRDPNLLLLDEPTNHLDLSTLILLEEFLKTYNGSYLVISHDREFLRATCDRTLEVDQGKLYFFPGSLDAYLAYKEQKQKSGEKHNKKIRQEQKHLQAFVDRFRYKASKASQAQSKIKQIKRLSEVKIRDSLKTARIIIPPVEERKGLAIRIDKLQIGYLEKIVAQDITMDISRGRHIAVLGDNGQGKSTFLKTLDNRLAPLGGRFRWMPHTRIAYYSQHNAEELSPKEQVGQYLERQAALNASQDDILRIAGNFLFYGDDIKKSISVLSGGERARLCLAGMLLKNCNVLLLDEPTNHLDFETAEMLGQALRQTRATIFFISHNREFIKAAADEIIEVDSGQVKLTGLGYQDYLDRLYARSGIDKKKEASGREGQVEKIQAKEARRYLLEKTKKLKKEADKLKKGLEYNHALEQKILKEYEADNYKYCREREEKLKQIRKSVFEEEARLLDIEIELEAAAGA